VTNSGTYYVVVTNMSGMTISLPASVAVGNPSLLAWGYNNSGQLGIGRTSYYTNWPVSVASNMVAVAAGGTHSLFVKTDGTLWAMVANYNGQLGNGTTSDTNLPISVPHLSVTNIFPADPANHSLALGINYTANSISLPGGIPTITFIGIPGTSYSVERSTDLNSWSVIWTTNEPSNGVFQFTDPIAPQPNA
jgi:hypothetical protein